LKTKTVVFLGSKNIGYECLTALIANQHRYNYQVKAIVCNEQTALIPKQSLTALATKNAIPVLDSEEALLKIAPFDVLISVQYHRILLKKHLQCAKKLAVNLHMAPLPDYRGCNQFSWAIVNEAKIFGTTLHKIDEGVDSGAILFEKRFRIPENCFVKTLYDLTEKASITLFKKNLPHLITGNYQPIPQKMLIAKRGTHYYSRKSIESLKEIDLNWEAAKIDKHIRATYFPPFEPPYTIIKGTKYYIQPKA
jgi:methionyl-tRNA formyltransferase